MANTCGDAIERPNRTNRLAPSRLAVATVAVAAFTAWAAAGVAQARTPSQSSSDNWAGYAVTAAAPFRTLSGAWTQPAITCNAPLRSYSAFWVGLGGFKRHSRGLEQIGTEADCKPSGGAVYRAWFELIPAPPVPLRLAIHPGDHIAAQVTMHKRRVTLRLQNLTTADSVTKTVRVPVPDTSSAEWIAEAPAACSQSGQCQTLPLADFGSVDFSQASATTTIGHNGSVSDSAFSATKVLLAGGPSFGPEPATASASNPLAEPSALSTDGSAFTVSVKQAAQAPPPQPSVTPEGPAPAFAARDGLRHSHVLPTHERL
jgi:hypothetical protein